MRHTGQNNDIRRSSVSISGQRSASPGATAQSVSQGNLRLSPLVLLPKPTFKLQLDHSIEFPGHRFNIRNLTRQPRLSETFERYKV